ncbi:phosphoadenosine phosphosulfate reductase family protein [Methyloversatilis discipulorum]|uniref:phosphoadenosine phosphosulfate reductase family protein n=1 Tax=Methyloversatilis discipulorum TaxID=1119528 RepID=UPI001A429178|nr:phosphoadenosine phosphosulfate reductase family protein [Methyloversatilis discipulorum]MBL8469674.1 phosphoadenosine phosphosulfate reductase family protein [Methyloversatilis discipulorum]
MILHVVSVSGGKDSTATLLLALSRFRRDRVVPIFCDTGNEHEAVYEYLAYLEQALDIQIHRLRASFDDEIAAKRMFIARDRRVGRQYPRAVVLDSAGNPVPKRDSRGNIVTRTVVRRGQTVVEVVPKTRKVGGGRKVRWTNTAKRRALEILHPTGNPYLDLCLWKGRFPSRKAQFCTEELKTKPAVLFQLGLVDQGHTVVSWQGVRRDESPARANALKFECIGPRMFAFRPLVEWSAAQVFDHCAQAGIQPNPLYLQGCSRVGCMPCINVGKDELRQISARWPEHVERIAQWELLVGQACKRGFSTMLSDGHEAADRREIFADLNIYARVEWAKTSRGGKQYDLLADLIEPTACASSYGLCG